MSFTHTSNLHLDYSFSARPHLTCKEYPGNELPSDSHRAASQNWGTAAPEAARAWRQVRRTGGGSSDSCRDHEAGGNTVHGVWCTRQAWCVEKVWCADVCPGMLMTI
jgi:hypothetical protein